jgi:hypothetical protein
MNVGRKKIKRKRKRGPTTSFAELVQKLWQPAPDAVEPKIATEKRKKPAVKAKRIRKG